MDISCDKEYNKRIMIPLIIIVILILVAIFQGVWSAVGLGILGFIILSVLGMIR